MVMILRLCLIRSNDVECSITWFPVGGCLGQARRPRCISSAFIKSNSQFILCWSGWVARIQVLRIFISQCKCHKPQCHFSINHWFCFEMHVISFHVFGTNFSPLTWNFYRHEKLRLRLEIFFLALSSGSCCFFSSSSIYGLLDSLAALRCACFMVHWPGSLSCAPLPSDTPGSAPACWPSQLSFFLPGLEMRCLWPLHFLDSTLRKCCGMVPCQYWCFEFVYL